MFAFTICIFIITPAAKSIEGDSQSEISASMNSGTGSGGGAKLNSGGSNSGNSSATDVYYDSEILTRFETESEVDVIVHLKDRSNITLSPNDTPEESQDKIIERSESSGRSLHAVLSSLNSSEYRLKNRLSSGRGFSAYITREAFEKLIHNPNVASIHLVQIGYIALYNPSPGPQAPYDTRILDKLQQTAHVPILVEMQFPSKQRIEEIVADLPSGNFTLDKEDQAGAWFTGNITVLGLYKLLPNLDIALVSLVEVEETKPPSMNETSKPPYEINNDTDIENSSVSNSQQPAPANNNSKQPLSWFQKILNFFRSLFRKN